MATTKNIPALNPYVTTTPETDPQIWRVKMDETGIGSRPSTMSRASQGKNAMNIEHVGGKK